MRGDYRVGRHRHGERSDVGRRAPPPPAPRAATATIATARCAPRGRRSGSASFTAWPGTGAVVVLLIAALPTQLEAAAALAVFAPMSIVSMAALTGGFAWLLTRPLVEPVYRTVLIPALGLFGLMFGLWYAGIL